MPLTKQQRKKSLPRGAQKAIADELKLVPSVVSAVMNGKTQMYSKDTVRTVQLAAALRAGMPVEEMFGSAAA